MQERETKSCRRGRSLLWLLEVEQEEGWQQVQVQELAVSLRDQRDRPDHCWESQESRHHQSHRQNRPWTGQASRPPKHCPWIEELPAKTETEQAEQLPPLLGHQSRSKTTHC